MRTVQQLYDDKRDKVIIDIRDKEEYDKETMDSAVQYFWEDMMNDLKMDNISGREKFLNTYSKKVPIYLLCYSGQKSEELEDKKDTYVSQLSGGQKQRVGIARALTTTPDILLCDEATSALDPQTTESILKLLKKINKEMGVTILLITHQMQVVQMICNKVAVMENGKVVESGSVLDVFGKPQALVTKRFVQTVINDQIPESIVSLVKEQKEHFQVERLKFIGSSVKRPVISDICQVEGIVVNILGATVQELQENVMCVFILQLIGSEDKICEAEKQIDANGVIRERVEVI